MTREAVSSQAPARPRRSRGQRLLALLPLAAALATFGVFFVDKSREASTVLGSARGLVTVGVIVGGYLLIAVVLRRLVRWQWLPPLALTVVVLALAAWTVRPYYVDVEANRTLVSGPVMEAPASSSQLDRAPSPEQEAPTAAPTPTPAAAPAPTAAPAPAAPSAAPAPAPAAAEPAAPTPAAAPRPAAATTPAAPPAPAAAPAPAAKRLSSGAIQGTDHDASGTASVIRAADGSLVVRLERFDIEGAPDPQVYLTPGEDARRPGGAHLGRLPGNRGQVLDIAVPAGAGGGAGWTVLIWCGRFGVPIANATQEAA